MEETCPYPFCLYSRGTTEGHLCICRCTCICILGTTFKAMLLVSALPPCPSCYKTKCEIFQVIFSSFYCSSFDMDLQS